ncbi:MAG: TIGR01906 family membrane protein [Anaerovoracaceae bacterium]
MKLRFFAKHIIPALFCVLVLLCLSISLTVLFRPLYYWDMDHLSIPERSGIPETVCRENYDVLIDYNLLGGPSVLEFPDFSMSESGRIHFEEVKRIFIGCQVIGAVGLVWLVGRILLQLRRRDRDFTWMRWTGRAALVLVALVGGLVAVNWDLAFVLMHKILFRNDFWIFDAHTDPIIKILPDTFFMHCGILIMVLLVVFVTACSLLGRRLEKPEKP